jgi:predicted DNA-binding transcriptional regulator YafY
MLSRFRDGSRNAWLEEVISNLEFRFGIKTNQEHIVSFEQNEQLRGLNFLGELIDSAIHHQTLRILYRSYYGVEHNTIVHPYHLKQFNNRWFLLGLEETDKGTRLSNKALDRIIKFSRANVSFIPNTEINFATYFKDIVGVTVPKEHPIAEKVILKFDKARFPYIVSKPIHPSQEVIDEEKQILQITVRPNKELESLLFSYGPQVEVLEPQWLREQIEEKISETLKIYLSGKNDCTE